MSVALSVVIPAFDEEQRIGRTLQATTEFLRARAAPYEVIVVDDGSADGTAAIVSAHAQADPCVRLLRLERNQGKGAAVRAGVRASVGQRVLFMDADLATPLGELLRLEAALADGADVAIGSRALARSEVLVRQRRGREWMGKTFNLMVRAVLMGGYRDTQCGFKLFRRAAADVLFAEATVDRFAFDVELLLLARGRFRVVEVPVAWRHVEQSKVSPVRDAARMAYDLLRLRLQVRARRRAAGV